MKTIYTCIIILFLSVGHCYSQQLITTAGMQENNVSWSIGELLNDTGSTGNMDVFMGFNQQVEDILSATPQITNKIFSFYPNPVIDKLTLSVSESGAYSWTLTDVTGRTLKSRHSCVEKEIDLSDLVAGQYILRVVTNSFSGSAVIIKK